MTKTKVEYKLVPELRFAGWGNSDLIRNYLFDELFEFSTGKNIKQKEASPEFRIPCVRYGELYHMYQEVIYTVINRTNISESELRFSQGNEILLPSAGEDPLDIGSASALTVGDVAIGRTINILRPKQNEVYSQIFVSYYINQKLRRKISTLAKGSSISNVYNSDLRKLKINLPSLPEQQKIATFLTAIDQRIQLLERKKAKLEAYKKGLMQKIFSQEIRFKDEDGNEFPDWEEKRLGEVGKTINGLTGKTKEDFGVGKPYIQYMQVFKHSRIFAKDFGYVNVGTSEKQQRVQFGDILFTTSSEVRNEIGTASVLIDNIDEVYLNSFCFGFRPYSLDLMVPEFSRFLFRSAPIRRKVVRLGQGSTRYNMSKVQFLKIEVDIPSKEEQFKISTSLSVVENKIDSLTSTIQKSKSFKKGLLQKMFV